MNKNNKNYTVLPMLCALLVTLPTYATEDLITEQPVEQQEPKFISQSDIKQQEQPIIQKNALSNVIDSVSLWLSHLKKGLSNTTYHLKKRLSSTHVLSTIKDGFNNRTIHSILSSHALGIRNSSQHQALEHKMLLMSAKEKQTALNDVWANVRTKKLQNEIKTIDSDPSLSDEQKKEKADAVKAQFLAEVAELQNLMKRSLKPNEFLAPCTDCSDGKRFEIVDMNNIDPTQPLTDQYDALEKSGVVQMPEKALAQVMTEYYANKVNLNFNEPVSEQILSAIPDWSNFDGQLQINILNTLTAQIPKEFLSPETNAQLDQEQEERRQRDQLHAQELKEQLEKDKAALKAGQKLPEESTTQESTTQESMTQESTAQEEPLAAPVIREESQPAPKEFAPVKKDTKKIGKKSAKKHKKQNKEKVGTAVQAVE